MEKMHTKTHQRYNDSSKKKSSVKSTNTKWAVWAANTRRFFVRLNTNTRIRDIYFKLLQTRFKCYTPILYLFLSPLLFALYGCESTKAISNNTKYRNKVAIIRVTIYQIPHSIKWANEQINFNFCVIIHCASKWILGKRYNDRNF